MTVEDFKNMYDSIPLLPGVYRFLDETGHILYVGKAKNLRSRLSNYFGDKKFIPYKSRVLTKNAGSIEFTILETEHDALLLENTLIKKFQPRYNVSLKDAKSYSYIVIKNEPFPRVFFTRKVYKDGSTYFGPYTSKFRQKVILDLLKKMYPLRSCNYLLSNENITKKKFKVCLEYHIKNCKGACEGFESSEDYQKKIDQIKNILKGNFQEVKSQIMKDISIMSEMMEFEKAQELLEKMEYFDDYQAKSTVVSSSIKDVDVFTFRSDEKLAYVNFMKIINGALINTDTVEMEKNLDEDQEDLLVHAILSLRETYNSIAPEIIVPFGIHFQEGITITVPQRGEKWKLLELSQKNLDYYISQKKRQEVNHLNKVTPAERILTTLKGDLHMDVIPLHIECFDNSNIQGSNPVASCVVFKNAKPSKRDYRHFKIKTVEGPNDFASMKEIVYRRYSRILEEGENLPQLIIIDGGKGQLSSAVESLEELKILEKVTVIGIAKKLEEIFFPFDSIPLYINKKSESLKLIQQCRNEAHRFAITFHRDQRSKSFLKTELTDIDGVGEKTADKLLKHFGSVAQLQNKSIEEIEAVTGKVLALKIMQYFQNKIG
jgi:excinuclease ABC subunit C